MEAKLIKLAKGGDKDAFEKLVKMYERKLYIIAKAKLKIEEDAKDAIQETLIQLYKNLKDIKLEESIKIWITKVLINNCNNIMRDKKIKCYSYEELECDKFIQTDDDFIEIESDLDLFSLLDFLCNEDRTLILMYFSKGYTTKEIGLILNMNDNTVRTKISRIKARIKQKYGDLASDGYNNLSMNL